MAASDVFPRGWSISTSTIGAGNAMEIRPACPGIQHILTEVHARLLTPRAQASQAIASLTIPAVVTLGPSTGVIYVVTDIYGSLTAVNNVTGWTGLYAEAIIPSHFYIGGIGVPADSAGNMYNGAGGSLSWSGKLVSSSGEQLQIGFVNGNQNNNVLQVVEVNYWSTNEFYPTLYGPDGSTTLGILDQPDSGSVDTTGLVLSSGVGEALNIYTNFTPINGQAFEVLALGYDI